MMGGRSLMNLQRSLRRWQAAGLLDEATAARILAHERGRPSRPYALYALGGLGALSIATGLLSLVASNWDRIGPELKLVADLLLLAALAAGVFLLRRRAARQDRAAAGGQAPGDGDGAAPEGEARALGLDVLLIIYAGATLASIGLVAQTYHLGGELRHALLFFCAVTFPLLSLGRGAFLSGAWLIALQTTWLVQVEGWVKALGLSGRQDDVAWLTALALCPLALLLVSGLPPLRRRRPRLCAVAAALGALQWLLLCTAAQFAWYGRGELHRAAGLGLGSLALLALLSLPVALLLPPSLDRRGRATLRALLLLGPLSSYAPLLVHHEKSALLAALGFIALYLLVGYAALRLRLLWLFSLATALIALRVLGVYFEIIGSLLDTGLGLIVGGALSFLVAWIWYRKTRQLRAAARAQEPEVAHGQ